MSLHAQSVAVLIPARNEAHVIHVLLQNMPNWVDTVVVADCGSTDTTAAVARSFGAIVVDVPAAHYGLACKNALEALAPFPPDIVVFLSPEFSYNLDDLIGISEPVSLGMYDVALATRTAEFSASKSWIDTLALHSLKFFWEAKFTDITPIRAIRWSALDKLQLQAESWGWNVEMQITMIQKGLRFIEVPITAKPTAHSAKPRTSQPTNFYSGFSTLQTILHRAKFPSVGVLCAITLLVTTVVLAFSPHQHSTAPFAWMFSTVVWAVLNLSIRKSFFSPRVRRTIICIAAGTHCIAALLWGVLSTDIHRYMWDGHVLRNHVSPYLYTPDSPILQPLHTEQLPLAVPNAETQTLYPPVAQAWFAVSSFIGTSWWGWKIPTLLCVLGSCVAVFRLVRIRQGAATNILMYITAPLLLFHGTMDAHVDIIMLFYLLSAMVLLEGKQPWWGYIFCGALLGMAVGTNFLPLLLLPWILRGKTWSAISYVLAGGVVALLVAYLPFWGTDITASLLHFTRTFTTNSILFTLLNNVVSTNTLLMLSSALFIFFAGIIWFRVRDKYRAISFVLVLFALCSPVVQPWQLLPLLAFATVAFSWTSFTLLCSVALSGLFISSQKNSGMPVGHPAIIYAEFIPVAAVFLTELYTSGLTALQLRRLRFGRVTESK